MIRWKSRILPFAAVLPLALAFAALPERQASSAPASAEYAGDTVHSHVLFRVKHMGASWSWGRFDKFTVSVNAATGGGNVDSVAFEVDAESVNTGNDGRDKHLRNADFLNAKEFPTISFKSTSAKAIDADTTEVTGDLTLLGTTKPVTIKVTKVGTGKGMKGEELVGYETTFTVKRTEWGMKNLVGPVGDEVMLIVAFEGMKK
jgi:polyisoprenoid-binding protein YceI